jgi:hypothetical protein
MDVPAETPESSAEVEPMVATEVVPELHVPPDVASVRVVDVPLQIENVPPIAAGTGVTVTTAVAEAEHPVEPFVTV